MSLTKSLYREEEVIAALKWCLIRGRNTEAVFWAQECLDSGLEREYLQALIWVWLFTCGKASEDDQTLYYSLYKLKDRVTKLFYCCLLTEN